jgi:hypothetical protein
LDLCDSVMRLLAWEIAEISKLASQCCHGKTP